MKIVISWKLLCKLADIVGYALVEDEPEFNPNALYLFNKIKKKIHKYAKTDWKR